ncbi:MAG TPA: hypothetical protein VGH37_13990, partial [Candidatus Acidoferrum sp.]
AEGGRYKVTLRRRQSGDWRSAGGLGTCGTSVLSCEEKFGKVEEMAERPVLVGLIPQVVVLDPGDQISWISDAGNLRVEFDPNRSPFSSNIFQAPMGMRLLSGPPTAGTKAGSYKYRLWLNDQMVGRGEVIIRDK